MYYESLKHWDLIRELSLKEAAMLMVGSDPNTEHIPDGVKSRIIVYQRAIAEAVQRAAEYAWEHARSLEVLRLDLEENAEAILDATSTPDIWEIGVENYEDYLPTIELRDSVAAVNADPDNVPILLPMDPWYTATVYGGDFNDWIRRAEIQSSYLFNANQKICVVGRSGNWDSQQPVKSTVNDDIPVAGVAAFADREGLVERPLATRERNVLLSIIAAACKEAKIDYSRHAKAARLLKDVTVELGLQVGESTIEGHLKRIPEAIESRGKVARS